MKNILLTMLAIISISNSYSMDNQLDTDKDNSTALSLVRSYQSNIQNDIQKSIMMDLWNRIDKNSDDENNIYFQAALENVWVTLSDAFSKLETQDIVFDESAYPSKKSLKEQIQEYEFEIMRNMSHRLFQDSEAPETQKHDKKSAIYQLVDNKLRDDLENRLFSK